MKRLLLISCLVIIMLAGGLLAACAAPAPAPAPAPKPAPAPAPAPKPHEQFNVNIFGGVTGGTGYALGFGLADLLNKKHPWLRGTARASSGSGADTKYLMEHPENRKNTIIWTSAPTMWASLEGKDPWFEAAYPTQRQLLLAAQFASSFLTFDPDIKELKDIVGKRVAFYSAGALSNIQIETVVAGELGADFEEKIDIEYLSFGAMVTALKDGLVDATWSSMNPMPAGQPWVKASSVEEIFLKPGAHFVDIPASAPKNGQDITGYTGVIYTRAPAGAIAEGHPEAGMVILPVVWAADLEMPEEVAYELVKFMSENANEFIAYHASAKAWVPSEFGLSPFSADITHPGAAKYYQEKGYKVGN